MTSFDYKLYKPFLIFNFHIDCMMQACLILVVQLKVDLLGILYMDWCTSKCGGFVMSRVDVVNTVLFLYNFIIVLSIKNFISQLRQGIHEGSRTNHGEDELGVTTDTDKQLCHVHPCTCLQEKYRYYLFSIRVHKKSGHLMQTPTQKGNHHS